MRIAQVAPLYESVPPTMYGGTERVVSWLTEELVARGHDVTLYASGDSATAARLVPCCRRGLRLAALEDEVSPHLFAIERAVDPRERYDVIHFHTGTLHFPVARRTSTPSVTTMHGSLAVPDLWPLFREFRDVPLVSISDEQRHPISWASWIGTVHHGMPRDLFTAGSGDGGYLAFLGRMSQQKRPDRAIKIARRAGLPLRIAAKIGEGDRAYFEAEIRPLLDMGDDVEFLGEVDDAGKQDLLGGAVGMLFPIDWPEPFGLAMIESLACGTPVIGFAAGSVPSIIEDGETGFVVNDVAEAVARVAYLPTISRAACRAAFERRFSVEAMTTRYLQIYDGLIAEKRLETAAWGSL